MHTSLRRRSGAHIARPESFAHAKRLRATSPAALGAAAVVLLACALSFAPSFVAQAMRGFAPASRPARAHNSAARRNATEVIDAHGAGTRGVASDTATQDRVRSAYGQLPLGFVANDGQVDADVKFSSRGSGYQLFLTPTEAVLALGKVAPRDDRQARDLARRASAASSAHAGVMTDERGAGAVLRMKLVGALDAARVSGEGRLEGKVNYLIGDDATKWQTNVPTFARVRYENIYPGITLVYYGSQRQLEYDFQLAPHADPRPIKLSFEGAQEMKVDSAGQLLLRAGNGLVIQRKPVAYQLINGARRGVSVRYTVNARREVGIALGKYDRSQPLVIDPVLSYATYLGGTGNDQANGVAVDSSGNAYITGQTLSGNFPTAGAPQPTKAGQSDAFVLKLNPAGTAIVYSTYLGGSSNDIANGIAVDSDGNAYITGSTFSANFPHTAGAFQPSKSISSDAFVAKLNQSGASLVYSTFLGGNNADTGYGIGVDAAGNAYIAGSAASTIINGTPVPKHGSPAYRSTDAGGTWSANNNGITDVVFLSITVDPTNSNTVYAAGSSVYKSTDGGASWNPTAPLVFSPTINASPNSVTVDPTAPSTLYAATQFGVFKSTDGGGSWVNSSNGLSFPTISNVLVDPNNPATLYAATPIGASKSINGGASWTNVSSGLNNATVNKLVIDPTNSNTLYAATQTSVFKTTNGGASWTQVGRGLSTLPSGFGSDPKNVPSLVIDPTAPATLYAATRLGVYKTTDGGANWSLRNNGLSVTFNGVVNNLSVNSVSINPLAPATLYAATVLGVYKTVDGGANWSPSSNGLANNLVLDVVVAPTTPSQVYAATNSGGDAFVAKLDASGGALGYLAYLGGNEDDFARGIAVDAAGDAYLTGTTNSSNFPVASPAQATNGSFKDAFVTKLSPNGSIVYSTYLGGDNVDDGMSIALDAAGRAYITGDTFSGNFPATIVYKQPDPSPFDLFVTRLAADGSLDYSFTYGGTDIDQGFGIAADGAGNAYVTGTTDSFDFPVLNATQDKFGLNSDAFVLKVNPSGSIVYSSFLGGNDLDQGLAIAADNNGAAYLVGSTVSSNFPTASPLQPALGGGLDAFAVKLQPGVDLALAMTDAPDPVALGSNLTYTLKVSNIADVTATGVRVTDTLPAGANLVSTSATQGACSGASQVVCDLGSLAGGANATVNIVITPPTVRTITNNAVVSANETEPNTANNTATASTVVDFADLSLTASTLQESVAAGGHATYLFAVANNGAATASNVVVNADLPAGMTFVSCTTPNGTCSGTGNSRTITLPTLAVGATQTIIFVGAASASAANGTVLTATAHIASSLPDPDTANNSAAASVTIAPNVVPSKLNGKIAFIADGLYVMNDDGTNPTKIYAEPGGHFSLPVWSPDGTRIAFVNEVSTSNFDTFEIRVVNADGSAPHTLSTNGTLDSRPTWSPSGTFVGFVARNRTSIQVVNATGTPVETSLISNLPLLSSVSWSPDGTKFLYGTTNGSIWTVNTDGSGQTLLSADPSFVDTNATWSPDGTKILFLRRPSNGSDIDTPFLSNADGTGAHRVPNFQGDIKRPVFSPDGQQIAFERQVSINGSGFSSPGILKMNADGTNVTRIPADGLSGSAPSWQPLPNANPTPTPTPAATFTISGHVARADGVTPLNVSFLMNLTGSRTASVFTDLNGNYSFTLPAGGTYTVTPTPNQSFSIAPAARTFTNLSADQTGVDFTATRIIYSVSGHVTDTSGTPLSDIEITLNNSGSLSAKTRTAADGSYSFTNLSPNGSYSVFVSLSSRALYSFLPDAVAFSVVEPNRIIDFVGTPLRRIQLSSTVYFVGEGDRRATVTVTRAGDLSNVVTAQFQTVDDPAAVRCDDTVNNHTVAYARCDYATTVTDLEFAPGEASKTVSIPIIDDGYAEGVESFVVRLVNVQGASLNSPSGAAVTIEDNDAPNAPNPIFSTGFFVRQQYLDFLSREPEPGEPWSATLDNCAANDPSCDRISVSANFFRSQEFQLKGLFVYHFYKLAFNRQPLYAEIVADMSSITATTTAEVNAKKAAFPYNFSNRAEFKNLYQSLSNQQFVDTLMGRYNLQQITTINPATPNDTSAAAKVTFTRADLVNLLDTQFRTRQDVMRAIADSNEVGAAEFNPAFVAMQYFGYLRRDPDTQGYNDWLRTINANPADFRSMVNGFMNSQEYRLRFGQ